MAEDWQDDNEIVGSSFFGPITKKQQREAEERQKAAEQKTRDLEQIGSLSYASVPIYDAAAERCAKCGCAKSHVTYCGVVSQYRDDAMREHVGTHECLLVWCKRCKHRWYRRPLKEDA